MKKVANCYYVHKSSLQEMLNIISDDYDKEEILHISKFTFLKHEIIKYNSQQHKVSFIESPDWNTANEPTVGNSYCYNLKNASCCFRKGGTTVYHSKELFVSNDYTGFDIQKAKERTKLWSSMVSKDEKKLIGNKKHWIKWCNDHGIDV